MHGRLKSYLMVAAALISVCGAQQADRHSAPGLEYTSGAQLKFPERYREWVYLSTGFDMSYSKDAQMAGHHLFDNVFVDPESYRKFLKTGTWPDKTMLVLEVRAAVGKESINRNGSSQGAVTGVEVHVKDAARGGWAFYGFDGGHDGLAKTGSIFPATATCYRCHADHGAVDTTFVQFYPTLLPIATVKGTLSAAYLKEK